MKEAVRERLAKVIDPETGLNVLRMGLVRDLDADADSGVVKLTFRPSSSFCPMAFKLATDIREAVRSTPGVRTVEIKVENYVRADELEALLKDDDGDEEGHEPK